MNLQLDDKMILITGGAKGIGAAIARGVCEKGAIAVLVDKDTAAGEALAGELVERRHRCFLISTDLTAAENCRAVDQTVRDFKRLDALVNNAGVNDRIGLEHGSPPEYLDSLRRNVLHYFNMAHFAVPHLKQSRGSIVNIGSKVALTGQGGTSGYASAKGAILALTREWAAELLPYGIRVNAVLPAEVMTPLYQPWLNSFPNPEEKLKMMVSKIPPGKRITTPEEIAAIVIFLL